MQLDKQMVVTLYRETLVQSGGLTSILIASGFGPISVPASRFRSPVGKPVAAQKDAGCKTGSMIAHLIRTIAGLTKECTKGCDTNPPATVRWLGSPRGRMFRNPLNWS